MTKTSSVSFAELRELLRGLGYSANSTETAQVFHRARANMLVFRRYGDHEMVDPGDVSSTRKFLDAWGLLAASDFDAFFAREKTTA